MLDIAPARPSDALVAAAFDLLADHGHAALQPADVAVCAGVDLPAEALPSREALVAAVVEELIERLVRPQVARYSDGDRPPARDLLHWHLTGLGRRMRDEPGPFIVFSELLLAGRREPTLGRALQSTEAGWHAWLVDTIEAAKADGSYRTDVDAVAAAWLVMAAVKGFDLQLGVERELPGTVFEQLELLLLQDPRSSR